MVDVSLSYFQQELQIDKNQLDEELIKQPATYFSVCEQHAYAMEKHDMAKDEEKRVRARIYFEAKENKDLKLTDPGTNAYIEKHPDYLAAATHTNRMAQEAATWLGLKEAFQQRSYVLKDLAQLHNSGYFTSNAVRGPVAREAVDRRHEENRDRMAAARADLNTAPTRRRLE